MSGYNVLVVDDKEENIESVVTLIQDIPHISTFSALSGTEALQIANDFTINTILLDISMPGMSGYETAELLHKRQKTKHIPIIFMTAFYKDEIHIQKSFDHGAIDHIEKPIDPMRLLNKLNLYSQLYFKQKLLEKSNQTLREMNKKLEMNNQTLKEYAAIISHDLKEPVRSIKMFSSLIQRQGIDSLSEKMKQYLKSIMNSASRMYQMVDELYEYSRLNITPQTFTAIQLDQLIKNVEVSLQNYIEHTNAKLIVHELPSLECDGTLIGQLFQNLISNALKYHREDVPPIIEISSIPIQKDHLPEDAEEIRYHQICVKDNGIGIEKKYFTQIFGLFERLHGKNEYSGIGIGLAVCQQIVHLHNGYIRLTSELGKGTSFYILLPDKQIKTEIN